MPGEKIENYTEFIPELNESESTPKTEINVDDLKGRVCYFSLSGNLALQAFENKKFSTFKPATKKKRMKQAIIQRLQFAVLMFDIVVMHCSDPLRSELILAILEEHIEWIKSGKIVFIFSNHIKNINTDYEKYIEDKVREYSEGYYSEKEASSLKQSYINPNYFKRVIQLLDKSPFFVRKTDRESYSFARLVINDLSSQFQKEQVIIDSSSDLSQILSLSLSLYQLLHARVLIYATNNKPGTGEFIFPQEVVDQVTRQVQDHLNQGNTIARSAIDDSLREALKDRPLTAMQENILEAISLRMDVLYCRMNSGEQMILEFHPSYEHRSMYQASCFSEYMDLLAQCGTKIKLDNDIITKVLDCEELSLFRLFYLACMADMKEYMNLAQVEYNRYAETMQNMFSHIVNERIQTSMSGSFKSIKKILNEVK